MLSLPIVDHSREGEERKVLGCLQCLNKLDNRGIPDGQTFKPEDERPASSFASLVAVALKRAQPETPPDHVQVTGKSS